ncbi:hypothetical protein L3Q82_022447 [Scortum barcoo]|uniref:Uncharacterized protein n=1 Tax=Scortum barcoo TaxID=214431 RepID=A0ACB8X1Q3_9TELE|nr:hypothetical protein L3Q82_022447 [Scortum barcoo]
MKAIMIKTFKIFGSKWQLNDGVHVFTHYSANKRGAELVNRSPPGGELDLLADRPKRNVRNCWERLAEPSVREVFNSPPLGELLTDSEGGWGH